ncbi:MAG: trypsin-like peptidase domain-containing protein [Marinicella sp.]|nr:trypsin-like peptidase domain-containing protein [Xanthomonadales bacterium]
MKINHQIIMAFRYKIKKLIFGFFLLYATMSTQALTPQEIAKKASKSTVEILTNKGIGSGFIIDQDHIVTNAHVIEGAETVEAYMVGTKEKTEILGYVALSIEKDLVILKAKQTKKSAMILTNSDDLQVGDTVYVIGSPHGLEGTFSQGIISRLKNHDEIQITAPVSPGSSGGPVLNSQGHVVGIIVSSRIESQNINFAIPSNEVKALLKHKLPPKPFTSIVWPNKHNHYQKTPPPYVDTQDSPEIINVLPSGAWIIDLSLYAELEGYHTGGQYSNPFKFYGALVAQKLGCKNFYENYTLRNGKRYAAYICLDEEVKTKNNIAHYKTSDLIAYFDKSKFLPLIGLDKL